MRPRRGHVAAADDGRDALAAGGPVGTARERGEPQRADPRRAERVDRDAADLDVDRRRLGPRRGLRDDDRRRPAEVRRGAGDGEAEVAAGRRAAPAITPGGAG